MSLNALVVNGVIINMLEEMVSKIRRKTMSQIKSNNTSIELLLCKALWHEGIRYRKNVKTLPGRPDIAITKYKIAIFCDGEFWHGMNWETKKKTIKSNRNYWLPKIERNIMRDNVNEKKLSNMGWLVFRFWGNEISKKLECCVNEIKETIYEIENGIYDNEYNSAIDFFVSENEQVYDQLYDIKYDG